MPADPSAPAERPRLVAAAPASLPIHIVSPGGMEARLATPGPGVAAQAEAQAFKAKPGQVLAVVGADGAVECVLAGASEVGGVPAVLRALAARLPPGDYALAEGEAGEAEAVAWALGGYAFRRYKAADAPTEDRAPRLVVASDAVRERALRLAAASSWARDLVNTPANDMGPAELEAEARRLAERHGARVEVAAGDDLLPCGYPAVHAVGRAAVPARAPRMIEIGWTAPEAGEGAPHVVVVGKGVVFDTGGLDIKPSAGMRLMKKDMGGAAHALALADMVMGEGLPVRLTVLVPAVENAISGDAMRPGDVLATRKGLSVEVGNTDAEGRLILADALTRAGELQPDLTVDLATLTGAARVALGPELPPFYTPDDGLAGELAAAAAATADPLWRMPLWAGYEGALDSDLADLKNDPDAWAQAGSVTAALFLQRFAPASGAWVHLDIFAWNPKARPGWPAGGEAQAIRALFQLLRTRYGKG